MRTSTFFVSFIVHASVIAVAVVVPMLATDVLPRPSQSLAFVASLPEAPTVAPPPRAPRAAAPTTARPNPDAAPLTAPADIQPESNVAPVDDAVITGAFAHGAGFGDVVAPPPAPAPAAPQPQQPVRVGGVIRAPQKTHHVAPAYPPIALSARVSGVVILEATIAEDGSVRDVRVLRSIPLLDAAALDAVRQWRFTPSLLNGVPVPVVMTVTVAFNVN